jgi:pimeloyl-ACP methyl ester carboxylesterase
MQCELVNTRTPDSARLDGALVKSIVPPGTPFDAALLLSGLAGNFYSSRLLTTIERHLLQLGIDVLQANTRGHDGINWLSIGGRTIYHGAAFERVDDCRHDLAAWFEFLRRRGYSRIVLVGHSLGAIKSLYAQAHQPDPAVQSVVALSASRLNHDRFLRSPDADNFQLWMDRARQLVESGAPRELMQVDFPFPAFISAEAYLDKYGPPSRYDWTGWIARVAVPVLMIFGEREIQSNAAFQDILEDVRQLGATCPQLHSQVIPGADHFYSVRRHVVSTSISQWLSDWPPE